MTFLNFPRKSTLVSRYTSWEEEGLSISVIIPGLQKAKVMKQMEKPNKHGRTLKSCALVAVGGVRRRRVLCFSQEPKFPASVLLGVCFGLAFRGGGEGFLGVRQGGEVAVLRRAKPLHQRLQLVLLLLEVQLHTAAKKKHTISSNCCMQVLTPPHPGVIITHGKHNLSCVLLYISRKPPLFSH